MMTQTREIYRSYPYNKHEFLNLTTNNVTGGYFAEQQIKEYTAKAENHSFLLKVELNIVKKCVIDILN